MGLINVPRNKSSTDKYVLKLIEGVLQVLFNDNCELSSLLRKAKEFVILGMMPTPTSRGLVKIFHILKSLEVSWSIIANEDEKLIEGGKFTGLMAINNLLAHFEKC
ncbi:uncharacterized protein LOC113564244 [Drosophila erecta]|uniref:uncharacterized protein LOC113564244 n=1 Tax=Drosophila erecta TaxID=7220 RepID=UPI000F0561A5|nr:uncharacterized protein LOC113564244 [Drosophila erecta]